MNIPTDFENNPNIGCRVTDVDRRTDRPTDRRRATAIGPVDLKMTFTVIQSNPSFGSSLVPSLGSFLHK